MVDRSAAKPSKNWLNPYLQSLVNSDYPQSDLQFASSTNPLMRSTGERQRQAQRMAMYDLSSRTINLDPNRPRQNNRLLGHTSERSLTNSYEQSCTANTYGRGRIPTQSTPNIFPSVTSNDERPARINSAYQKTLTMNHNLLKSDHNQVESSDQPNAPIEERLACEITTSYGSATELTADQSSREEVIVIQRYSTGEHSLVYRGYLTKGQSFSFKSQRRPTSSLSLALYVQGSLSGVINECCEFKCTQINPEANDPKKFVFESAQKANPCEKCRKDYADKLLLNNDQNTMLVRKKKKLFQNHGQSKNASKQPSADDHTDGEESSKTHQQEKKPPTHKKPKSPEVSHTHHTETMTTDTSNPQESPKPSKTITAQSIELKSAETSGENAPNPNETGVVTSTSGEIDVNHFMQMLAAHFKQNTKTSVQQNQSSRTKRHPKSVENFCYIFESRLPISNDEQQTLHGLINLGFTFADINSKECVEFLKRILHEKVILILSTTSLEKLAKPIQDEPLLCAIYVIASSEKNSFDSQFYRGSFPDVAELCKQLQNDLQSFTYDSSSISSIPAHFAGMSTLNYVQALTDILLEPDENRDLKKEMIDFCREEYVDNVIQLKMIDEFENTFQPNDAIHWYLRHEAFPHKMMTRAFRVFDPDILFKLRYFIQHLHSQLKSSNNPNPLTVYRTLRIRKDLLNKMKTNEGALLSFNEFLLLDKTQSTTEPSPSNTSSKLVRFELVLGTGVSRSDVASLNNGVLLTAGTIFRLDKLEYIDEETYTAKLTTNDETIRAGQLVTKDLRDALHGSFPLVRMVKLMRQRELTGYIEYFCSMFIDDPQPVKDEKANLALGGVFHWLGGHYYEKKQYEQALSHLRNSLNVYLRVLPDDDTRLTPTYNNIGSIYHKQGLNEQALEYHQKAYEIQKNSADPDMNSVSAYAGNIASVLMKLSRYKEAAKYLEFDLQIKQKLYPNNDHEDLASRYHNLAGAQYRLHQYSEAVENYQKCLDIELKCHSAENPTVAVTYYNMATALEELGRLQDAKEAAEKAILRLLLTQSEDSEQLQMHRKYIDRLEKKLWMKNLFAST